MGAGAQSWASAVVATGRAMPMRVPRWAVIGVLCATALQAAKALGEDVHALWPALRQARPARAISPELVALYQQRADIPSRRSPTS